MDRSNVSMKFKNEDLKVTITLEELSKIQKVIHDPNTIRELLRKKNGWCYDVNTFILYRKVKGWNVWKVANCPIRKLVDDLTEYQMNDNQVISYIKGLELPCEKLIISYIQVICKGINVPIENRW